jgi:hypothetical protein
MGTVSQTFRALGTVDLRNLADMLTGREYGFPNIAKSVILDRVIIRLH